MRVLQYPIDRFDSFPLVADPSLNPMESSPVNASFPSETNEASALGQGVLRFLAGLGQRSEAELYLRIFKGLPRGRFALIAPESSVLDKRAGTLAEQLGFLRELGLYPSLVVGAVDRFEASSLAHLSVALREIDLPFHVLPMNEWEHDPLSTESQEASVRVFVMDEPSDLVLARLTSALRPHKTLFLRRGAGLGPHDSARLELTPGHVLASGSSGIGAISLRGDAEDLRASGLLPPEDLVYLDRAEKILASPDAYSRATVSIASPLSILRELFTVSGEGTLIKRGSDVQYCKDYGEVDHLRLFRLIEESFGRRLDAAFLERKVLGILLEVDYRGVALVQEGQGAAYLSKFAVLPEARGEGLGQDLFWALSKKYPQIYWRARPENPINAWYRTVCDGMHQSDRWAIYYRGVSIMDVPHLVKDALERPVDLSD